MVPPVACHFKVVRIMLVLSPQVQFQAQLLHHYHQQLWQDLHKDYKAATELPRTLRN
jgi:hypothetical protein